MKAAALSKAPKNRTRTKNRQSGPHDPQGADKYIVCSVAWKVQEKKDQREVGTKEGRRKRKGRLLLGVMNMIY